MPALVWAPARAMKIPNGDLPDIVIDRVFVEAAGSRRAPHDTIALVPSGGFVFHAANIADAITYGAELVASARIARTVSLTANYTHLVTAQLVDDPAFANKPLPREPGDVVYARVDVVRGPVDVWIDGSWQSETFVDPRRCSRFRRACWSAPARASRSSRDVGVSRLGREPRERARRDARAVPPPRPGLTSAPTPLADYAGYPLPGRSYYVVPRLES